MEPPSGSANPQPLPSTVRATDSCRGPQPASVKRSSTLTNADDIIRAGVGQGAGKNAGADDEHSAAGDRDPEGGAPVPGAPRRRGGHGGREGDAAGVDAAERVDEAPGRAVGALDGKRARSVARIVAGEAAVGDDDERTSEDVGHGQPLVGAEGGAR